MNCKYCSSTIPPKRATLGYDICLNCAEKTTKRYLGRRMEKCIGIEIFRTDIDFVKSTLKRENRIFGPNINISHPIVEQTKDDWRQEE